MVVMVGDLIEADILGAQRAGIHHIWLRLDRDLETSNPFEQVRPDAIAEDLAAVPGLIQNWT
jgi:FMN phosphatase YigB (HAD superfamily)